MRLNEPRVEPVTDEELNDEQKGILEGFNEIAKNLKLFRTILKYPNAFKGLTAWGNYIQSKKNDLQGRKKEIVILRTSWNTKAAYEWSHHSRIGRHAGLSDEEIEALKKDPGAHPWDPSELVLIKAVDDLYDDDFVTNETWSEMSRHYSEKEMMDVVMTCGHYTQISRICNSFGIGLDEGAPRDEDLVKLA